MTSEHELSPDISTLKCKQQLKYDADWLIDSGATHNFIDTADVAKHKLQLQSCSGNLVSAGKQSISVSHYVRVRVKIQSFV